MVPLQIQAIQTKVFKKGQSLTDFIVESIPSNLVQEKMIVAITSKIVSLAEMRLVPQNSIDKKSLVKREADKFLGEIGHGVFLTIKDNLLIPSSGIDESNSEFSDYILYPENPDRSADELWGRLRQAWQLRELGLLLTDSHTTPLRRGVTGITLSYSGFSAVRDLIGTQDLFGRVLRMTQINYADALSSAAVLVMGEGGECRPLATIHGAEVEFRERVNRSEMNIPLEEDLYFPLLNAFQNKPTGRQ